MLCSSCSRQRNELHPKKSRLMAGMVLYLCNDCIRGKMEPRYLIVLYGRANGPESVAEYIRYRRYHGTDILAKELLV